MTSDGQVAQTWDETIPIALNRQYHFCGISAIPHQIVISLYCDIFARMGLTKAEEFSVRDNRIAGYAKALSHPARVAILHLLAQRQSCMCGDIVQELPLSQSTVSQHLKELKQAGLIKGEIEGVKVCYCIDEKEWKKAREVFGGFFEKITVQSLSCC
jgi:DNA-binding transcriptional ArsR family regulator